MRRRRRVLGQGGSAVAFAAARRTVQQHVSHPGAEAVEKSVLEKGFHVVVLLVCG
jgi:uncharacterized membrane protein YdjX (TVP38/TMEM64 family)